MLVLISPAKTMKQQDVGSLTVTQPRLLGHAQTVLEKLRGLSAEELEKLMKMNAKLGQQNFERYQKMDLCQSGSAAVFFYDGIQYKNMELCSLTMDELKHLSGTVRILSGMYGILRPMDGIWPYRLEMQQKGIALGNAKDLYEFWRMPVTEILLDDINTQAKDEKVIVNLASGEYSKLIADTIKDHGIQYVTCTFKVDKKGTLKVESTASKVARGQMVRYIAQHKAETVQDLMLFSAAEFVYREDLSDLINQNSIELVFVKTVQ